MQYLQQHILTITIFLPLIGMFFILCAPSRKPLVTHIISIIFSLVTLALTIKLYIGFQNTGDFEYAQIISWVPSLQIYYRVGVDGVSILLMILSSFLVLISILASLKEINKNVKAFYALILFLQTGVLGVFAALDLFLFFIFWEIVLIPMYFIIAGWGSGQNIRSAMKFFIFTMLGSVLMLAAILYGSTKVNGSFDLINWYAHRFAIIDQFFIFSGFALAFAIKTPLFPFHTWLPDAHSDAPTAGSVLLAGILLKLGVYGFYRIAIPIFPLAVVKFSPIILTLAVIGIIYAGLVAMIQPDIKRLVAYSSIAHLGFIVLGLFSIQINAVQGAVLQMINHGLSTGALFLLIAMIYKRTDTRKIEDMGGLAKAFPLLSASFILVSFSSLGLPGLNNFVGEFLILLGSFQTKTVYSAVSISGIVIAAIYMLWAVQRIFFGKLKKEELFKYSDLTFREQWILLPIIILIVFLGVYPNLILDKIQKSTDVFLTFAKKIEISNNDKQ